MAIITISREMGSGGIPIAHRVAKELGYTLVDGSTLKKVAHKYGLSDEAFEHADERPPAFVEGEDVQHLLDLHQIELMVLNFALKGDVVIYGRAGEDLLRDILSAFRVRIIAPFEDRVERWAVREWLDPDLARLMVRKSDQQRAGFIRYYFDREWENPLDYDLVINTQRLSEDKAVEMICSGVSDNNLVEEKGSAKKILTDLILGKKAEIAILSLNEFDCEHLIITAKGKTVTISGHVLSKDEHKSVLAAVKTVEGVEKIADNLSVIGFRTTPYES
ncbi:MAG: cytidylate kinase-like family protein [Desulfuromonadales bacterium]|nr:cytidylate kinase-like family protein [Desulfuromonadales bacterium]